MFLFPALYQGVPSVDQANQHWVESAQKLLLSEGVPSPIRFAGIDTITVQKRQIVDLTFVDSSAYSHHVSFSSENGKRVYSPQEIATKKCKALLAQLGIKGNLTEVNKHYTTGWEPITTPTLGFEFKNERQVDYVVYFDRESQRVVRVEREPAENFKCSIDYKYSPAEFATAKAMFEAFVLGPGDLDRTNRRTKDDLEFEMRFPPKRTSLDVQAQASLSLDRSDLSVVRYSGPTPRAIQKASTPPPIDPAYLVAAKGLRGTALGETAGRRFAHVEIGTGKTPALGWISADLKTVICLDGIEYPVGKLDRYEPFESALKSKVQPSIMQFGPDLEGVSLATPALLLENGQPEEAKRLLHVELDNRLESPEYLLLRGLHDRYRLLLADALINRQDREGLNWATNLCLVDEPLAKVVTMPEYVKGDRSMNLTEAPALKADLARRVAHPKPLLEKPSNRQLTVEELIKNLDEIDAVQMMEPGSIDFSWDQKVKDLIAVGPAAIPALIEAVGTDKRYTRSTSNFRDFFPPRYFHPVKEIELIALKKLWPSCPEVDLTDQTQAAETLRSEWQTVSSMSEPERMVKLLAGDDQKGWEEAGAFLSKCNASPEFRSKYGSEINELLACHAEQVADVHTHSSTDLTAVAKGLTFAHDLALWNPEAALPALQKSCKRAIEEATEWNENGAGNLAPIPGAFGNAILDRMGLNDPTDSDDFRAMLRHLNLGGWFQVDFWRVVWTAPADSPISIAGRKFIASLEPLVGSRGQGWDVDSFIESGLSTRLLTLHEFRKLIADSINNEVPDGEAYLDGSGKLILESAGSKQFMGDPKDHSFRAPSGGRLPVSAGDRFCERMERQIGGAPEFTLWSSAEGRKAAKAKMIAFVLDDSQDWLAIVKKSPFFQGD